MNIQGDKGEGHANHDAEMLVMNKGNNRTGRERVLRKRRKRKGGHPGKNHTAKTLGKRGMSVSVTRTYHTQKKKKKPKTTQNQNGRGKPL